MQYVTLEDQVYFHFALNTPAGGGAAADSDLTGTGTGTTYNPDVVVREAGLGPSAAPTYTLFAMLLDAAVGYPAGSYEVQINAGVAHGFAADKTYAVFCSATVSSVNPTGYLGSFRTSPPAPLDAAKGAKFARAVDGIATVTVGGGSSTTSVVSSACSPAGSVADEFKDRVMVFDANTTTAALRGVAKTITASTGVAAPTFTVGTLPATPASGDTATIN